ncbi:hypothetical protein A3A76_05535 [Candidatus Woesebacteria bacterium RIFCSPLOWO2_01_FULL_39_23]|uniref:SCP domain-containing protein n=1 Tax=Candidatus Woesebacteria bacterium RIFCSPHIGHO2_01_FULL_40_22 TaxID=1802499 RepID=A0A1F7YKP5_9BACT|nr:MAG: hypothetical protein A2141_03775 [Candidatus Woesebacteria bacterium RBG_16_40_11]OGM27916.1 MAG: hypothetical protein A2628_03460 [Candidatus Woesebacteria bacterium RIFCSPHIGHO2_01_FULL_40_22]OGM61672.1 MAG: hypothetical protein A3A76_05535 [Candidatus Woesebacteria bacterium RIFCSPLOWO2_01_FULL_39_23]
MGIKFNLRKTADILAKTLLLSATLVFMVFFISLIYFLGYLNGYTSEGESEGVTNSSTSYLVITPVPTEVPAATSKPKVVTEKKSTYGMSVDWGGPQLWEAVNKRRTEFGVNPLRLREEICTLASIRLNELLTLGKLDAHQGFTNLAERRPDLKWIFDEFAVMAEFLAVGGKTPQETVGLWENTLGHKQLLTGGEYVWGCIYSQSTFAVAITAY